MNNYYYLLIILIHTVMDVYIYDAHTHTYIYKTIYVNIK
jgi:hypothetical protein